MIAKRLCVLVVLATFAFAEGTKSWQQSSYEEFTRGTAKGVALRSDGTIELAPSFKSIHTSPSTYIWSAVSDKDGTLYIGTGSPARVYRIAKDGKATIIFEPKELQVQSLALDKSGVLYAATSPDGKVYRIEKGKGTPITVEAKPAETKDAKPEEKKPEAKQEDKKDEKTAAAVAEENKVDPATVDTAWGSTLVFDPKTKYIWAIAFNAKEELFVATGDKGEIYRLASPKSSTEGTVFFKSDEAHIRSLAFAPSGDLIAGSDGSGLVYRVSQSGEGFVLYSAPKKEITSIAVSADGTVYAAAVGEKRTGTPIPAFTPPVTTAPQTTPGTAPTTPQPTFFPTFSATGGSDIYAITSDGLPRRLWTSREDIVYALAVDSRGRVLAGTGNKGRVVSIDPKVRSGDFSDLPRASANQVTGFAPAPDGGLYVVTSNLGKVFSMSGTPDAEGTFESEVFDARITSRWGRVEVRGTGDYELLARSGNVDNPDRNWSQWKKADAKDMSLDLPPARFVQYRAVLKPGKSVANIESIKLNYRPKNIAPIIDDVAVQTGARFTATPTPKSANETVMVNVGGGSSSSPSFSSRGSGSEGPMPAQRDRNAIAVRWAARDDNDDTMLYSVYYRGDGESRWKLLKDKLTEKYYSWESGVLPDGGYTIKVFATDSPSQSPDEALSDSRESARFEIDNTPPRIDGLTARIEGDELHVGFAASDTFSNITRAEISVDAGEWQFIEPVGQLSDAQQETYDLALVAPKNPEAPKPAPKKSRQKKDAKEAEVTPEPAPQTPELSNEHVVVVRVFDRFENMTSAKIVVK